MFEFSKILTSLFALVIGHALVSANAPPPTQSYGLAQNATAFALVYGFSLTQYVIFANSIANKSNGVWTTNSILHEKTLANASYHTIVLPNVDTLQMYQLWQQFLQPWDSYKHTNSSAGGYLITPRPARPGCDMTPSGKYAGTIYMPTVYGAALLRIQVNSPADTTHVVNCIQPNFTVVGVRRRFDPIGPRLSRDLLNSGFGDGAGLPLHTLELTARIAPFNPPEVERDVSKVTAILKTAGLEWGSYSQPPGVDLAVAFSLAKDEVQKVQTRDFENFGNGWTILSAKFSGDFLYRYAARAFVAAKGYMQLRPTQALYPVYNITETLLSSQTYRVQFFGKPAVDGFWSLTMYDQHGYLVPNELNRFSLNNRDNMTSTYPNGGLVRDTALDSKAQFYMLLQSTLYSIAPEWESNWLPSPPTAPERVLPPRNHKGIVKLDPEVTAFHVPVGKGSDASRQSLPTEVGQCRQT
ncbi:hypothetical protein C8J57DRAFT_1605284 [Mycena rebaudengoi]|nr:hypothetical protein C8J57DRAFT_1605284 [Mycena rebaudengoi]